MYVHRCHCRLSVLPILTSPRSPPNVPFGIGTSQQRPIASNDRLQSLLTSTPQPRKSLASLKRKQRDLGSRYGDSPAGIPSRADCATLVVSWSAASNADPTGRICQPCWTHWYPDRSDRAACFRACVHGVHGIRDWGQCPQGASLR